jgi:hypothetical protein
LEGLKRSELVEAVPRFESAIGTFGDPSKMRLCFPVSLNEKDVYWTVCPGMQESLHEKFQVLLGHVVAFAYERGRMPGIILQRNS